MLLITIRRSFYFSLGWQGFTVPADRRHVCMASADQLVRRRTVGTLVRSVTFYSDILTLVP